MEAVLLTYRSETREKHSLTTLFLDRGVPDPEAGHLSEVARSGDRVVSIHAISAEPAGEAEAILNYYGATDIEVRFTQWRAREPADPKSPLRH